MSGGNRRLRALAKSTCATAIVLVLASACSLSPGRDSTSSNGSAASSTSPDVAANAIPEGGVEVAVSATTTLVFPEGAATGAVPSVQVADEFAAPSVVPYDSEPSIADSPDGDGVHVVALGEGASVELDDGETQPSSPVLVSFTLPDHLTEAASAATSGTADPSTLTQGNTGGSLGAGVGAGNVALLLESADGSIELVPATYDPATGQISGEVPHFSSVWPVSLDLTWLTDTVLQGLSIESPKPDCDGKRVDVGEAIYSTVSQAQMWMCVDADGSGDDAGLVVLMRPNAPTPFIATPSRPATQFLPDSAMSGTAALASVAGQILTAPGSVAVFPGAASRLYYDDPPASFTVELESAPQLYVVQILSEVAGVLLGLRGDALAKAMSTLDCAGNIIPSAFESNSPAELMAGMWQSFFSCAEQAAETLGVTLSNSAGILLAIVAAGPQLLIGGLSGVLTNATGLRTAAAPVDATYPDDEPGQGDAAAFLGTWSGPIEQGGSTYYGVEVALSLNARGNLRGKVHYPELDDCSGSWVKPRLRGNRLRMIELIGGSTRCTPEVKIEVRLSEDGAAMAYDADGGLATGMLTRGPYQGLPEGAPETLWPVAKDEAPITVNVWLGANGHSPMSWSACDVAGTWCVIGQGDGEDPIVVEMANLRYAGSVPWDSPNPAASLRDVGMPAQSAQQALS